MRQTVSTALAVFILVPLCGKGVGIHLGRRRPLTERPSGCFAQMNPDPFPDPGEWPCFRRNGHLDGHSPLKGAITSPSIAWTHFIGAYEALVVATPGKGNATVSLTAEVAAARNPASPGVVQDVRWGLTPPQGLIEGHEQPIPRDVYTTFADVLPDAPGFLEKLVVKPTGTAACFAWRDGAWKKAWETEPMDFGQSVTTLPIVGDFDADGKKPELAFLPWWNLIVVDAQTGSFKDICRFTEGRSYGYFGVHDLDGNGKSEFVVEGDFAKHVDVLGYRDGKIKLLWQNNIELDISNPQTILRVNPDCVSDVDGDGKREVLVCLCNAKDDGKWRVTVHDGLTGRIKAELMDEYLSGVVDVDGDGACELLTTRTAGSGVPEYGPIQVISVKGGQARILWESAQAGWQTWDKPLPMNIHTGATYGTRTVLSRRTAEGVAVVLRQRGRDLQTTLSIAQWRDKEFRPCLRISGSHMEGMALDERGCLLLRTLFDPSSKPRVVDAVDGNDTRVVDDPTLHVENGRGDVLGVRSAPVMPATPATARSTENERPSIVVEGSGGELVALHPPQADKPAEETWRMAGRGQNTGASSGYGPVIADLEGDGRRQVILATAAPSGCGRLRVVDLAGKEVWYHDFDAIPGGPPVWNEGAIILWRAGHFTSATKLDVLVTVRRSMMHSDETALLSGRDGHELWRRVRQATKIHNRGVGGVPFALADYDGDGLDDTFSFYPSEYFVMKGGTGETLKLIDANWDALPGKQIYFGIPVTGDFENHPDAHQAPAVFMAGSQMTGLVRRDGTLVWHDAFGKSPTVFAFGDFSGSTGAVDGTSSPPSGEGRMEAMGFGYEDGIRCYDTATGKVKWHMEAPPGGFAGAASADINSDGRDEALLAANDTLYCYGSNQEGTGGNLLWKVRFPAVIGPPAIVGVDGSDSLAILVVGQDGNLYCVK